ncbi:TPA: AmmeMemoRadiSam system protein B [Candidatus Falkowbacteria bacterium]|nr:AmmeMemoRadiSam system protein B [Candidatus Falkowbacteria bacterium]
MTKLNKILLLSVILLGFFQGGLLFLGLNRVDVSPAGTHRSLYVSKSFYDDAYRLAGDGFDLNDDEVVAAIVPHHLFVKDRSAALFKALSRFDFQRIIMIGPDHLNDARASIVISDYDWQTPYGSLSSDSRLVSKILDAGLAATDEQAMGAEFAISGLVPFVKNSWPEADFVPIIIGTDAERENLDKLVDFLVENSNGKTLLLTSVDFSHYKSPAEAEAQDKISVKAIEDFDFERAFTLDVDSPQSIYMILKYAARIGANLTQLLSHTNTGLIQPESSQTAVTHNIIVFTKPR